jgi:hypothetical protein
VRAEHPIRRSAWRVLQPDSWLLIVQKFHASLLQHHNNAAQCFGAGFDGTVKLLHALDCADRHLRLFRKFTLRPSKERSRRA